MNIIERDADIGDNRHSWLLLFFFLSGSLLSLLYMPERVMAEGLDIAAAWHCMSAMLLFSAVLSLSVCGQLILPLVLGALGVLTALGANAAYVEYLASRPELYRRLLVFALLVPANFALGSWGMDNSGAIRSALAAEGSITKKQYVRMYTVMAVSAAVSCLPLVYAVLK